MLIGFLTKTFKGLRSIAKENGLSGGVAGLFYVFGVILFALILFAILAGNGWIIMILAGAVHGSLWAAVPAFSFWQSFLIATTWMVVASFVRSLWKD